MDCPECGAHHKFFLDLCEQTSEKRCDRLCIDSEVEHHKQCTFENMLAYKDWHNPDKEKDMSNLTWEQSNKRASNWIQERGTKEVKSYVSQLEMTVQELQEENKRLQDCQTVTKLKAEYIHGTPQYLTEGSKVYWNMGENDQFLDYIEIYENPKNPGVLEVRHSGVGWRRLMISPISSNVFEIHSQRRD